MEKGSSFNSFLIQNMKSDVLGFHGVTLSKRCYGDIDLRYSYRGDILLISLLVCLDDHKIKWFIQDSHSKLPLVNTKRKIKHKY